MEGILNIKKLERVYLLFGEEVYLKQEALKAIEKQSIDESDLMNYVVFEGKETTAEQIINACETMPFFAEYKVVVVREGEFFKTGKKDETDQLTKWIKTIHEQTVLVFVEKEIDKRNGLYKAIQKQYQVVESSPLNSEVLVRFVQEKCQERGIQMPLRAITYFVANMPPNITHLLGELDKLESYSLGQTVTQEMIEAVCVFSLEQRVFTLIKEVANKEVTRALKMYHRLIEAKESPIMILSLIARQYRLLLQVKYLARQKMVPAQIAKEVGLPGFVVKEHMIQAEGMSFKAIQTIIEKCLESDAHIKTGKMEGVKCVELLIMKCIYPNEY